MPQHEFEKTAIEAFEKLAVNVIQFSPPASHDGLLRELPGLLEQVLFACRALRFADTQKQWNG